jgi:AraC-like DNA-binding protein
VAELARRVCLSRSVFASRFKNLLSTSPMQYLMERRMQKACELLAEGQYGIKQIASQVGYASKAAFSNAFKRWSGQSPQVYRRCLPKRPTDCIDPGPNT